MGSGTLLSLEHRIRGLERIQVGVVGDKRAFSSTGCFAVPDADAAGGVAPAPEGGAAVAGAAAGAGWLSAA